MSTGFNPTIALIQRGKRSFRLLAALCALVVVTALGCESDSLVASDAGTPVTDATLAVAGKTTMAKINNATSSAPPSISDEATVLDWPSATEPGFTVLREGTNEWTCMPDLPLQGIDPMCVDAPWMAWMGALGGGTDPDVTRMGFGYMLQDNDSPYSNTDPGATGPTPDNEWQESDIPHLMILVPSDALDLLSDLPTDPNNGGPWVMWRDTPYAHIMAPMPRYIQAGNVPSN